MPRGRPNRSRPNDLTGSLNVVLATARPGGAAQLRALNPHANGSFLAPLGTRNPAGLFVAIEVNFLRDGEVEFFNRIGRDRQSKAAPVSRLSVLEASPSKGRFQQPWGIHSLGPLPDAQASKLAPPTTGSKVLQTQPIVCASVEISEAVAKDL